jgi:hypothetical protein
MNQGMNAEMSPYGPGGPSQSKCDDGLDLSYGEFEVTCQPPCGVEGTPSCLDASALPCLLQNEYMPQPHACLMMSQLQGLSLLQQSDRDPVTGYTERSKTFST